MFSISSGFERGRVAFVLAASSFALTSALPGPVAAAGVATVRSSVTTAAHTPFVNTLSGPVLGKNVGRETEYLGIPYAAAPVGQRRWRPPAPHPLWTTPLQATRFGPHCPQGPSPFGIASLTEDCLFLNVYTPKNFGFLSELRPVMVWIHGGAFVVGESDDYDPIKLVDQNVDVVTLNYRLGALGFLAHPALDSEGHLFANYGTLDQQAALRWVKRNIAAFGGDPRNVTIFGESAGGASVMSQLASPLAHGTFDRAIMESGAYANTPTLTDAEAAGTAYATSVGCSTAACLRGLSVAALLAKEATGYVPTVDGTILPQNPKVAIAAGQFNRVPVMDGSNGEEFRLFTSLDFDLVTGPITAAAYPFVIAAEVGSAAAPAVVAEYPLSAYPTPDLANSAALTDATFSCPALFLDQSFDHFVPTFAYEFSDVNAPEVFLPPVAFPYEAAHASELQYLFTIPEAFPTALTAAQERLSQSMVVYWTTFARFGVPFDPNSSFWFPFFTSAGNMIDLNTPHNSQFASFGAEHKCAFWNVLLDPAQPAAHENARHPMVRAR
jgi:para-nitrobenzyl esterase